MSEPIYPNVRCDAHPDAPDEPGYVVCKHVIGGAPVVHFEPATEKQLGTVLCGKCSMLGLYSEKELVVGCAHLIRESGWDRVQ
jgi:hypothetical protein